MKNIILITLFGIIILGASTPFVRAAVSDIVNVDFPCTEAPGFNNDCGVSPGSSSDIRLYIIRLYQFAVGAAGIIAVGVIVAGAIYISATGNIDKQSEGRDMITSALWGLALLFGSWLILNTINPNLVELKQPGKDAPDPPGPSEASQQTLNNDCGEFTNIQNPFIDKITYVNEGCGDRIVTANNDFDIEDDIAGEHERKNYYDIAWYSSNPEIEQGARLWQYPYYFESRDQNGKLKPPSESAKCLIYAYLNQEEDDEDEKRGVRKIGLNNQLKLCAPKNQNLTSSGSLKCTEWALYFREALTQEEIVYGYSRAGTLYDGFTNAYPRPSNPPPVPATSEANDLARQLDMQVPNGTLVQQFTRWDCTRKEIAGAPDVGVCSQNENIPENTLSDIDARLELANLGIQVTRGSGNCTDRCTSSCTSLKGIPASVIGNLGRVRAGCENASPSCADTIVVTGGTEVGHQTHGIGKPVVDLRFDGRLATFLRANVSSLGINKICTTAANSQYRWNCNYNEPVEHLHVEFNQ